MCCDKITGELDESNPNLDFLKAKSYMGTFLHQATFTRCSSTVRVRVQKGHHFCHLQCKSEGDFSGKIRKNQKYADAGV